MNPHIFTPLNLRTSMKKSVTVWHNILTTALLDDVVFKLDDSAYQSYPFEYLILWKIKQTTQKLNIDINLSKTENVYAETMTYFLLCLSREYKQNVKLQWNQCAMISETSLTHFSLDHKVMSRLYHPMKY